MNLTQKEKDFYEGTFTNLKEGGQILDQTDCMRLLGRGISDSSICDQVKPIINQLY